jgi:hypothetical protein
MTSDGGPCRCPTDNWAQVPTGSPGHRCSSPAGRPERIGRLSTTYGPFGPYLVYCGSGLLKRGDMIATEDGLTFTRDGTGWRCLEVPGLWMLPGGAYAIRIITGEQHILGATAPRRAAERDARAGTHPHAASAIRRIDAHLSESPRTVTEATCDSKSVPCQRGDPQYGPSGPHMAVSRPLSGGQVRPFRSLVCEPNRAARPQDRISQTSPFQREEEHGR